MKLENLTKHIESKSIEEHEQKLDNEMVAIQLEYVDRLFKEQIKSIDGEKPDHDMTQLLYKYTQIPNILKFSLYKRTEYKVNDEIAGDLFQKRVINNISDLYEKDHEHWIEKTRQLMKDEIEALGSIQENKKNENKLQSGLINFDIKSVKEGVECFGDFCIDEGEVYMLIHFEDLYKQKGDGEKNLFSSGSLEKLAINIVDKFPETKAIVGESWMMDTPIAMRIGFKVSRNISDTRLSSQFWGQFIDSEGQVNSARVSKFLETGDPPYRTAIGVMKTEDFLRKYLPPDRRGKIILKEVKPDFEEQLAEEREIISNIKENWDKITEKDIIDTIYNKCQILFDFTKTEKGKDFIPVLLDSKRLGRSFKETLNDPRIGENYDTYLQDFIKSIKYQDKEVLI